MAGSKIGGARAAARYAGYHNSEETKQKKREAMRLINLRKKMQNVSI